MKNKKEGINKRTWKKFIIFTVILEGLFVLGMWYGKSIGDIGTSYGCLFGAIIGVFLSVAWLCPTKN